MITYTESAIQDSPYTNFVQVPSSQNHNHTFWEIVIVLSGNITHVINGKARTNSAGSVTFLRPLKDSHYFLKTPDDNTTYRHRDIYVSVSDMDKWCGYLSDTLYKELYEPEEPYSFSIQSVLINYIESSFLSPDFEFKHNPTIFKNVQFSTVINLLTHMQVVQMPEALPQWLKTLIQTLSNPANFSTPVETLTHDIPYSHCHICREFKKYIGQTVANYFIKQKISYASYLLVNTNLRIIDIANTVGYDSPKNFINQFTKLFKVSPSEWRKKNQISVKK